MEYRQRSGRAVMRGPAGWVLNMGGRYGTPGICTRENFVRIGGPTKLKLLTKAITTKLLKNGAHRDKDHAPVVKFFYPCGAATWLISELDSDGDTMFGLCDLGHGEPELGYVSLTELAGFRGRFGLGIERDLYARFTEPMSHYADKARAAGRIVA